MAETGKSTKAEILDATRAVLVEHGYNDLSMGKIADEFGRSQSLLHYHFDSKEQLLAALLGREREEYAKFLDSLPDDPEQRLDVLVDSFVRNYSDWAEREPMSTRYMELMVMARHSEPVREEMRAFTEQIRELFVETVREGVEAGVFAAVDPEYVGHLVSAANTSAGEHWMTGAAEAEDTIADALEEFVISEVRK